MLKIKGKFWVTRRGIPLYYAEAPEALQHQFPLREEVRVLEPRLIIHIRDCVATIAAIIPREGGEVLEIKKYPPEKLPRKLIESIMEVLPLNVSGWYHLTAAAQRFVRTQEFQEWLASVFKDAGFEIIHEG